MAIRRPTYDQDPIALWLDYQLPKLIVEQARINKAEKKKVKQQKDQIAVKRVENAINTLTPNSTQEEYQGVTDVLNGFGELYSDDDLMSEYTPLLEDMMTGKVQKQEQSVQIKTSLDNMLSTIQTKVKSPHDSKGLTDLVANAEKFYASNIDNISKGEAQLYKTQLDEMNSATTLAHSFNEFMAENAPTPDNPYQAKEIVGNDIEYQNTWDNAHDSYLAGDYTSARNFINKAKAVKSTSNQKHNIVTEGLETYFEKDENGDFATLKGGWKGKSIPHYNEYTGMTTWTNLDGLAQGALDSFSNGDFEGALSQLRKMPKSFAKARDDQEKALSNELKSGSDALNSLMQRLDPDAALYGDGSNDGDDDSSQEAHDILEVLNNRFSKDKNENILITDRTKTDIATAISDMVDFGGGRAFNNTEDRKLMILLSEYKSAKKSNKKPGNAAENLAMYILNNDDLIVDMDFNTKMFNSEAPGAVGSMNTLLEAYAVVNGISEKQDKIISDNKEEELYKHMNP